MLVFGRKDVVGDCYQANILNLHPGFFKNLACSTLLPAFTEFQMAARWRPGAVTMGIASLLQQELAILPDQTAYAYADLVAHVAILHADW